MDDWINSNSDDLLSMLEEMQDQIEDLQKENTRLRSLTPPSQTSDLSSQISVLKKKIMQQQKMLQDQDTAYKKLKNDYEKLKKFLQEMTIREIQLRSREKEADSKLEEVEMLKKELNRIIETRIKHECESVKRFYRKCFAVMLLLLAFSVSIGIICDAYDLSMNLQMNTKPVSINTIQTYRLDGGEDFLWSKFLSGFPYYDL